MSDSNPNVDSNSAALFDLKPTVEYAQGDMYKDAGSQADVDNVLYDTDTPLKGNGAGGMCTEVWQMTKPVTACVKFEGTLRRKFNTGDTANDLVLGYQAYQVHAQAGLTALITQAEYKFAKKTVDYTTFNAADTGALQAVAAASGFLLGSFAVLGLI